MGNRELIDKLRARLSENGLTLSAVATRAGFQPGNLRRMLGGDQPNPRIQSLLRVLRALKWRLSPFSSTDAPGLIQEIRTLVDEAGLSIESVAERSGLSVQGVKRLFSAKSSNPSLKTFIMLCTALGIELDVEPEEAPSDVSDEAVTSSPAAASPSPHRVAPPSASRYTKPNPREFSRNPRSFLGIADDELEVFNSRRPRSRMSSESSPRTDELDPSWGAVSYSFSSRVRESRVKRARDLEDRHVEPVEPIPSSRSRRRAEFSRAFRMLLNQPDALDTLSAAAGVGLGKMLYKKFGDEGFETLRDFLEQVEKARQIRREERERE